jgi:ATP-dependent helicase/nuclease subunit A
VLLAEFLGERKLANLQKLIEQARSFDRAGIFTLSDFITQLSEFVARQPDEALAATHPESTNVVKLMSIHQSKGLEFPVVFVPDVSRPRRVIGPAAAFTPELGPMFKDEVTTGYDLFMMAEGDEDRAEYSRLFYVATTRAADMLILSAGVEEPGKAVGPWMELLDERFDLWTGVARNADTPTVKVTTTAPAIQSKPVDLRRRRDLMKIIETARKMADSGSGRRSHYLEPIAPDAHARLQFSFSQLTGKLHARDGGRAAVFSDSSDAASESPIDPRGQGTLVHAVLAEIDFARPNDVAEYVQRRAEEHLSQEASDLKEPIAMIERFLASPRAAAIASAREVHRELEFLLAWPPDGDTPENHPSDGRYLQGYIDCLYCDADGRWRLIDYKTNRATPESLAAMASQYELQMFVYAMAVERILRSPPAELVLYFLQPGLEYRFEWNDAARHRVVELVNRAVP